MGWIIPLVLAAFKALPELFRFLRQRQERRDELDRENETPRGKRRTQQVELDRAIVTGDDGTLSRLSYEHHAYSGRVRAQFALEKARRRSDSKRSRDRHPR